MSDERRDRGWKIMQRIHGRIASATVKSVADTAPDLGEMIVSFAFGDVYSRPGLDLKTRQICTVAMLAAMGAQTNAQLRAHIRGALNVGWTQDEIVEVLIQTAVYAGFPAALSAVTTARETFAKYAGENKKEAPVHAEFHCSSPKIQMRWEAAVKALEWQRQAALAEVEFGGPVQLKEVFRSALLAGDFCQGDYEFHKRCLTEAAEQLDWSNPTEPPFGASFWIISLWDYYLMSGDEAPTKQFAPLINSYTNALDQGTMHSPLIEQARVYADVLRQTVATGDSAVDRTKLLTAGTEGIPTISVPASVLGVTPLEPGFACVRVAPQIDECDFAQGVLPIPHGIVSVNWQKSADKFTLEVSVPVGDHLRVFLPAGLSDDLFVDGAPITEDAQTIRTDDYVELAVLPGSPYRFEVIRSID